MIGLTLRSLTALSNHVCYDAPPEVSMAEVNGRAFLQTAAAGTATVYAARAIRAWASEGRGTVAMNIDKGKLQHVHVVNGLSASSSERLKGAYHGQDFPPRFIERCSDCVLGSRSNASVGRVHNRRSFGRDEYRGRAGFPASRCGSSIDLNE